MYSDTQLFTQLEYYQCLFDADHAVQVLPEEERAAAELCVAPHRTTLRLVHRHATTFLEKSARRYVDLGGIFKGFKLAA